MGKSTISMAIFNSYVSLLFDIFGSFLTQFTTQWASIHEAINPMGFDVTAMGWRNQKPTAIGHHSYITLWSLSIYLSVYLSIYRSIYLSINQSG